MEHKWNGERRAGVQLICNGDWAGVNWNPLLVPLKGVDWNAYGKREQADQLLEQPEFVQGGGWGVGWGRGGGSDINQVSFVFTIRRYGACVTGEKVILYALINTFFFNEQQGLIYHTVIATVNKDTQPIFIPVRMLHSLQGHNINNFNNNHSLGLFLVPR